MPPLRFQQMGPPDHSPPAVPSGSDSPVASGSGSGSPKAQRANYGPPPAKADPQTVHLRANNIKVIDFAYGLPPFAGQSAGKSPHNYQQLTADEALHNAESYNLFAEHVTFGRDTRFGRLSDDLATFQCGTNSVG